MIVNWAGVITGKLTAPGSPVLVMLAPDRGGDHDLNQAANLVRQLTGRDPAAYTDEAGITVVYASPAPAYQPPGQETAS